MTNDPVYGEKARDFAEGLGNAARQNPISAALIGMGAVWLFTGGGTGRSAARRMRRISRRLGGPENSDFSTKSAVGNSVASVGEQAAYMGQEIGQKLSRFGEASGQAAGQAANSAARTIRDGGAAASDFAQSISGSTSDFFKETRSGVERIFKQQPLFIGALGIAIGAGIAASFPSTEIEASSFGDKSDDLKKTAAEFASRKIDELKSAANEVTDVVTEEARRQGLTSDELKSAVAEVTGKAQRVAGAAGQSLSERLSRVDARFPR